MIIPLQVVKPIALAGPVEHEIRGTAGIGEVRPPWVREHPQIKERVALRADGFRHLLKIDQIETQTRVCMQELDDVAPCHGESLRTHAVGETPGQ